ncbi:MAG: pitrilysin family protein [Caulobacteraceae bacterium]|nr:pitrilysin family protein [Caulobacteraceae bacterium]
MRPILAGLAAAALIAGAAPALAQAAPEQSPPGAQAVVPPVDYRTRVLANGLHVYSVLDRSTPNVSIQMWYGVGAKNDPAGRSGFAHLFEHLMFKATRDMPAEYMDRLTEDVGGFNNASTDNDFTDYFEVVPANHLQRLLWAESERLSGLVVDEADFKSERAVVEEELRQRVLADPYGRLFSLDVPEASFAVHPYHRPPIGSIADLEAATLADVRAFHAVYYRPDNVSLIVVGNFDPARLDAWIDQYFAPIAKPAWPIPAVTAVEPPRTAPRSVDAYGPDVPLPAVVLSYPGPDAASPDAAALDVLDAVMSTGKSSRLYQSLVYRQQVAESVFSQPDLRRQPGLIVVGAILAAGKTPDQGASAIEAELQRLRDEPVSAAELAAAKNQLIAGVLRSRETIEGRGFEIGQAITVEGDAARVNSDIADLEAVGAADVQRVARAWLDGQRQVMIRYRPESERPAGQPDALVQDSPQVAAAPLVAPVGFQTAEALPAAERQAPPAPTAPLPAVLPVPVERTLPNGLRVIVARTGGLPIVSAQLSINSGAAMDPQGLAGLTDMTANLLPQGTTSRSAVDIAAAVEALGGSLSAEAGYDQMAVSLSGLSTTLPQSLPILADVVRHPAFAQDELDRLRQQKLDELSVSLGEPSTLADLVMSRVVFGDGPYGHPADGAPASLKRIDRAGILAQYQRLVRPDNAVLVLTGDIEPEAAFALAEATFGDWARPTSPLPHAPPSGASAPPRVVVVDLPGAGQAAVALGGRSIARTDPAYYPVEVADSVLGGGYSARLNEEIRVKRGLSYGAGSSVQARRDAGRFYAFAQTKNESADEVAGLMLDEVRKLGAAPVPAGELEARKASLTGEFGRSAATSLGLAGYLSRYAAYGVDPRDVDRFTARTEAVDAKEALTAAPKVAIPSQVSLVVVGDAKLFLPALKRHFPNLQVVEAKTLDLSAPDLIQP